MPPITPDEMRLKRNPPRPLTDEDLAYLEEVHKFVANELERATPTVPGFDAYNIEFVGEMSDRISSHKELRDRLVDEYKAAGWDQVSMTGSNRVMASHAFETSEVLNVLSLSSLGAKLRPGQGSGRGTSLRGE